MKRLYEIALNPKDEDDIYFARMTPRDVADMRAFLRRKRVPHKIKAISSIPGYHSFGSLMRDWDQRFE